MHSFALTTPGIVDSRVDDSLFRELVPCRSCSPVQHDDSRPASAKAARRRARHAGPITTVSNCSVGIAGDSTDAFPPRDDVGESARRMRYFQAMAGSDAQMQRLIAAGRRCPQRARLGRADRQGVLRRGGATRVPGEPANLLAVR